MKNFFREVQRRLISLHIVAPQGHALKRINNISGFVSGMIRKGSSHMPDIGSGLRKNINADSKTIAAKRFLENKWTDYETHFLPFLSAFIRGILTIMPLSRGIVLVIDGSQMGNDNAALMVSMVWRNRGIPLCWFVKQGGKGHFKSKEHLDVLGLAMEILRPLIPQDVAVTVLGDGEFDGIALQKLCLGNGWNYVLRTACNTVLHENNQRFYARDLQPYQDSNCGFIEAVEFTEERFKCVNLVCWHDVKRHENPIFLVSSLSNAGDIIEYYDQRYSIECLFKDMKSTSFNLHKTRLKKPNAVSNLILIASIAFILLTTLAIQYDCMDWRKKVQRVRSDQKVLSFFSYAYKLIHHFMDYEVSFNFSFQFSKNFSDFQPKIE
jgi:hypothetical protein